MQHLHLGAVDVAAATCWASLTNRGFAEHPAEELGELGRDPGTPLDLLQSQKWEKSLVIHGTASHNTNNRVSGPITAKKAYFFLFNFYFFKTENTGKYLRFILKAELKRDLNDSCPLRWLSAQD